jgi:hypothetical protein
MAPFRCVHTAEDDISKLSFTHSESCEYNDGKWSKNKNEIRKSFSNLVMLPRHFIPTKIMQQKS